VAQLQVQIASYAIGGAATATSPAVTEVSWDDIVGALAAAGVPEPGQASYAHVQSLSLNGHGAGVGVPFPDAFHQALLVGPLITVIGV
jgi:hypothetical protein